MAEETVEGQEQQLQGQPDPTVEAEARRGGWRPKEQFTGDPNAWVDAQTFVKRGREILPHVQRHSARLEQENATLRTQQQRQQQELEELRGQVSGLSAFRADMDKRERDRIRAEVIEEIKTARTAGDVDAEARAIAKLSPAPPLEPTRPATSNPGTGGGASPPAREPARIPQEMTDWVANNPWYSQDPVLSQAMNIVGADLRASGKLAGMNLTEQLNETAKVVLQRYSAAPARGGNRMEGGGGSGNGGGGGGSRPTADSGWESLPAHIKAECDAQGERLQLIGPKAAFKTKEEHRAAYAREYSRYAPGIGYDYKPPGN